ncbi:MAG: leucine-rich repeat domain-containing protein [Candidatus Aphodosoma sp.]
MIIKKQTITLIVLLLLSINVFADGVEIGGIYYELDRDNLTASVTYRIWPKDESLNPISTPDSLYTGNIIIPRQVTYSDTVYSVTSIGTNAFFGCSLLTGIKIPNTVTSINYMAFAWCSRLKELTFPESVTSMGMYIFTADMNNVNVSCLALTPPTVTAGDLGATLTIHVPYEVIPLYQSTLGWSRHTIKSILLDQEKLEDGSVNLSWMPVATADNYQICVEAYLSGALVFTDTLNITADSQNGGIMTSISSAPITYMPADEIGSVVIIRIDPSSGSAVGQPFIANVSTTQDDVISCRVKLFATNNGEILKQDQILFSLNEIETGIEENISVHSFFDNPHAICVDIWGRLYPISKWDTLPSGIYILSDGTVTKKVYKK